MQKQKNLLVLAFLAILGLGVFSSALSSQTVPALSTATGRKGIPTPAVFFTAGAKFSDLVPANTFDLELPVE